jgi:hypothetical protein
MKTQKILVFIFMSLLIPLVNPSFVRAQRSHFSVSLSPLLPLSSIKENASWGYVSGNIGYSFDLTQNLSWCLSAGYNQFGSQTATYEQATQSTYESNLAYMPVTSGFQYILINKKLRYYLTGRGGYYLPAADFEKGDWGISPGAGIQIPVGSKNLKIDVSLMYNRVFGSTTKKFTAYSIYGGSVDITIFYKYTSYLALNIGIVLGK